MSGKSMQICRSNRPGLSSALSSTSTRFVPPKTTTPEFDANPSISTKSWFNVFSRSSLPPIIPPRPRERPMASISSINTIHGASWRACENKSRTREGPTPTNISIKSEPDMVRNGTPDSPAVARASSVFPVPGGPYISAPFGILAPSCLYRSGFFKYSTNSMISVLASSKPATSLKVVSTFLSSVLSTVADAFPIPKIPPGPPPPAPFDALVPPAIPPGPPRVALLFPPLKNEPNPPNRDPEEAPPPEPPNGFDIRRAMYT
mmetsp:Transcript_7769/g.14102  ORF Transcript_7769/g.14102 Transcript_7769/m.14102 type:complete len:261 (-) Transcript_7769:808-1590(-)